MSKTKDKIFILSINGGAGKNVMATAVVEAYKKAHLDTKIIILTAWRAVWLYNPNVYRVYQFGHSPNFYTDFIQGRDSSNLHICAIEPYSTQEYILKTKHFIEIYCDLCGVPYSGEIPQVYFNQREVEYFVNKYLNNGMPIFAIQTNGGGQQETKVSWMRDIPLATANQVVGHFSKTHRIIHIRREDQPVIPNVEVFSGNLRELMILIKHSQIRLFMDSVSQHIARALDKKSTVLWIRNSPEVLGYSFHNNIVTSVQDEIDVLQDSVLEPYDITGNIYQCPFKEGTVLFDVDEIIESLKQ